jgi:hypothetical protein
MQSGLKLFSRMRISVSALLCIVCFGASQVQAAVLPEDRADALYHSYDGGGVEINGPSILIRKSIGDSFSASVNHYTDNVTSASIDVLVSASKYTEERDENSIGLDYLRNKTTMSLYLTNSEESDFDAETVSVSISQDMFGDLTTVTMGFSQGDNVVGRNGDDTFSEEADSRSYRLSVSQIFTKSLIMSLALESITDEGYLNNPYRSVRFFDLNTATQFSFQPEVYPGTRTSTAVALRGRYFLEHRAAINAGVRQFSDSWGIDATTFELGYTWPYRENWIFETSIRYYEQDSADFYSDLFPFQDAQNFLARDKELSTFTTLTLGFGLSYELDNSGWKFFRRGSLNFHLDNIQFEYDDFRDLTKSGTVGEEPLYSFDANVIRAFASVWF